MGYPKDLEEYAESELQRELKRRESCRANGTCDYCGRPSGVVPSCKYPRRHGVSLAEFVTNVKTIPLAEVCASILALIPKGWSTSWEVEEIQSIMRSVDFIELPEDRPRYLRQIGDALNRIAKGAPAGTNLTLPPWSKIKEIYEAAIFRGART